MITTRVGITPEGEQTLLAHKARPIQVRRNLSGALRQWFDETVADVKMHYLRGGDPGSPRRGKPPLAVRSGALFASYGSKMEPGGLSGRFGAIKGGAGKYAGVQLGDETWTIRPKRAKHLWIPVGENRNKSGGAKVSPREAFAAKGPRGGSRLSIFTSRNGNLVAFLREGGSYKRGKNKGKMRGKLLFVLKKQVTVEGTGAQAEVSERRRPRLGELLQAGVDAGLRGESFGAQGLQGGAV